MTAGFHWMLAAFDWETLIPIVFFALYGLAQFMGSKKKDQPGEEGGDEPEIDPHERARQIREEIRRKIAERQQPGEPGNASGPARDTAPPVKQRERPGEERHIFEPGVPTARESRRGQPPLVIREAPKVDKAARTASLNQRLEEQRRRLDHARRLQEEAKARAVDIQRRAGVRRKDLAPKRISEGAAAPVAGLRRDLIAGLREPDGLRKAVLYREILDPPLGLR